MLQKVLDDFTLEYNRLVDTNEINALYDQIDRSSRKILYRYDSANTIFNVPRNRYYNILPHEDTRFQSPNLPYINANVVEGCYILAQGPISHFIDDFLTMVWDSNADTIVCLAKEIELNKAKFDPYYDDLVEKNFGHYIVRVESMNRDHKNIIIRKLAIVKNDVERKTFTQIQYIGWPDHGLPSQVSEFLKILQLVGKTRPIVVHCSAGVGRTGTFCVVHKILSAAMAYLDGRSNQDFKIDVPQTILDLRKYRYGLVQCREQFQFCYIAIIEGLKSLCHTE